MLLYLGHYNCMSVEFDTHVYQGMLHFLIRTLALTFHSSDGIFFDENATQGYGLSGSKAFQSVRSPAPLRPLEDYALRQDVVSSKDLQSSAGGLPWDCLNVVLSFNA